MKLLTKMLYRNYTITACNPLYSNVIKLEESSFHQYGETLKKFNREINYSPMNNSLNVSDQCLHRSVFSKSEIK